MNFKILSCIMMAMALFGRAGHAQTPTTPSADIIVTDGDITDRPYRDLGEVTVTIRKHAIVDPTMQGHLEDALREKARAMHADAVIQVRRSSTVGIIVSLGDEIATGRAVSFHVVTSQNPNRPGAASQAQGQSPSQAAMKAKLQSYLASFNAGDAAAATAFYADDATIEDPVGSVPQHGRDQINTVIHAAIARDQKMEPIAPIVGSNIDTAGVELKVHSGASQSNRFELYTFNADGKIRSMTAYWGSEDQTNAGSK